MYEPRDVGGQKAAEVSPPDVGAPSAPRLYLCLAPGCGFFGAWRPENYCPTHRKPRAMAQRDGTLRLE